MGTRHAEIAPSPRGSRRVSMSGRPRAHHLCPFPSRKRKPQTNPPHASAADDDHRRGRRRRRLPPLRRIRHARRPRQGPGGLLQGTSLSPVPALLRAPLTPKLSAPLRLSATDGATRSALRPFSAGTRCLLRVHREARGQKAHRDRHHGSPLPRRLQKVPRRLRQQLPPHLGKRPLVHLAAVIA